MGNNKIESTVNGIYLASVLALTIYGARSGNSTIGLIVIIAIIIWVLRCIIRNPGSRWLSISVWIISISLLYQTTLSGDYLMGNDIHGEYYFANQILQSGRWNIDIKEEYNAAMGSSIIPASLSYALNIPLEWVFKGVLPLFFSIVPVALFRMTTKQKFLTDVEAFVGCVFFISVPTFFTEISSIGKEMIAEALMMLCLIFIVDRQVKIKAWLRYVMGGLLMTTTILCHYSTGIILSGYLIAMAVAMVIKRDDIKLKWYIPMIIIGLIAGSIYYTIVGKGVVIQAVVGNSIIQIERSLEGPLVVLTPENKAVVKASENVSKLTPLQSIVSKMERTTQAALALDFASTPIEGKIFRIIQVSTEILLILGAVWVIRNWRRIDGRFLGLIISGCCIMAIVIIVPGVSPILNATRFYHMALIGAWPCIILSTRWLSSDKTKKVGTTILGIIICSYLLFTSGFIFEALKAKYISEPWIPYSYGLSNARTDVGGIFSKDDDDIRDWIGISHEKSIYSDQWGYVFLAEKIEENRIHQLPWNLEEVPKDAYIFLRQRNNDSQTWIYWWGVGLRNVKTYEASGMQKLLAGRPIIHESGNAKYYGAKEE